MLLQCEKVYKHILVPPLCVCLLELWVWVNYYMFTIINRMLHLFPPLFFFFIPWIDHWVLQYSMIIEKKNSQYSLMINWLNIHILVRLLGENLLSLLHDWSYIVVSWLGENLVSLWHTHNLIIIYSKFHRPYSFIVNVLDLKT